MRNLETLKLIKDKKTIVSNRDALSYIIVSAHSQKKELETQKELLSLYYLKQSHNLGKDYNGKEEA